MDASTIRRENLARLIKSAGGPTEFAKQIDRSASYVSQLQTDSKNFGGRMARHIEESLGKPFGWLDTPQWESGPKTRPIDSWDASDPLPPGYETIQRLELYLSAGPGNGVAEEPAEYMTPNVFRSDFLKRMSWNPRTHFCFYVDGDSMEPTLADGSMVIVDTSQTQPKTGQSAVYAIKVDGEPLIKRLQKLPDGTIRVSSDNTSSRAYATFDVGPESRKSLEIIGKVVFYQTVLE